MKASIHNWLHKAKRRIQKRLRPMQWAEPPRPMLGARNICYEPAERTRGLAAGGIGAMHLLAQQSGLVNLIDRHLHLLKRHLPYHESDHVFNLAYNILAGGARIEHLELRRNDEVYLDSLGAERIPDPTTAGDFCRRFQPSDVERLLECINAARLNVWRRQPKTFFQEAVIDGDGTIAATTAECKQGMQLAYNGQWGYHPLLISLANTGEPLPVDSLVSNWAYMVMASLAWTLKAWSALWLSESGRWAKPHAAEKQRLLRMEFATFAQAMIQIPCQIVRTARRVVYRLLAWNPWAHVLLRLVSQLRHPLRC